MEKVKRLLAELEEHAEATALMGEYGAIETASDYAGAILFAAQRLGVETDVDASEIVGYLESVEASQRDSTEQAAEYVRELEDDDLEGVAGGSDADSNCGDLMAEAMSNIKNAFKCWKNDKCATFAWN